MKKYKKLINTLLAVLMALGIVFVSFIPQQTTVYAADPAIVRVLLFYNRSVSSATIRVNGTYSITGITDPAYENKNDAVLTSGVTYTVSNVNGKIVMSSPNGQFTLGSKVTLYSHSPDRSSYLTMQHPSYGTVNYLGNIEISVDGSNLEFINALQIEDYLCGVVPYEMSNGQPLEALKAQAVCARSYTYNVVYQYPYSSGAHLVDTTTHQVYKGYNPNYTRAITAIDQTAYQVLMYNGKYISTYYCSTNGGITESNNGAWGSSALPYLPIKVDEFDTYTRGNQFSLSKTSISSSNQSKLKALMRTQVTNAGYDYSTLSIQSIDSISVTRATEPASVSAEQRRARSITLTCTVTARNTSTGAYDTFQATATKTGDAIRTFLYYKNVSTGREMSLYSTLFSVTDNGSEFIFTTNGNGHGIGMSQMAAYARANAGQTYDEILDFYFTGTTLTTINYTPYVYKAIPESTTGDESAQLQTLGKAYSAIISSTEPIYARTGAGLLYDSTSDTLADGTFIYVTAQTDNWYQFVSHDSSIQGFVEKTNVKFIDEMPSSELTMPDESADNILKVGVANENIIVRSTPEYSETNQIAQLSTGEEIYVITQEDTWYKVVYNNSYAYVTASSIELTEKDVYINSIATVTGTLVNVRTEPSTDAAKLGCVSAGTQITVLSIDSGFAKFIFNGTIAYISTEYIEITCTYSTETEISVELPGMRDQYAVANTTANLRQAANEESPVLGVLLTDDVVHVIGCINDWYIVDYKDQNAYVMCEYLDICGLAVDVTYAIPVAETPVYVGMNTESNVLGTAPANTPIETISQEGDWILVKYAGTLGYIQSSYVNTEDQTLVIPIKYTSGQINASDVKLRQSSDISSNVLSVLKEGDSVEIISVYPGWYKVSYAASPTELLVGYIQSQYITMTE